MLNYFWPALIVVFSGFLLKEKLTFWKVGAVLVSFAGVLIYSADGNLMSLFTSKAEGVTFALLGAVVYSLYSVLNKRESYDKFLCITIACVTSAACSLVWVLASGQIHLVQTANWGGLIYQGVVCIGTAYLAWAYAMDAGDTAKVSTLSYLTPFVSLIFTCVFLGEKVTAYSAAGLSLIHISPSTVQKLWKHPNIRGIKSGNLVTQRILKRSEDRPGNFSMIFSNIDEFDIAYCYGIDHNLDGMFSCTPKTAGKMYRALEAGDRETAGQCLDSIPVSYTHLDVYKRQAPAGSSICDSRSKENVTDRCGR